MKKLAIIFFLLLSKLSTFGQVNLVPNFSFEIMNNCPVDGNIVNLANWVNPSIGTPDYFNNCVIGDFGIPQNVYGIQSAKSGNGYVGLLSIVGNGSIWREYIQIQLDSELVAGQKYCVGFYTCITDSSSYSINTIGAHLSINPISSIVGSHLLQIPQIVNDALVNPIIQPNFWYFIQDTIIAAGGEKYITIGNFYDDILTDTNNLNGSVWAEGYHLIDDVSIYHCTDVKTNNIAPDVQIDIKLNLENGNLTLVSNSPIKDVTISNIMGQQLVELQPNTNFLNYYFYGYPNGPYFIQIKTDTFFFNKKILLIKN